MGYFLFFRAALGEMNRLLNLASDLFLDIYSLFELLEYWPAKILFENWTILWGMDSWLATKLYGR